MLLQFVNNLQNNNLRTFHIEVKFGTLEKQPTIYKLELLAKLRDNVELGCLKTIIIGQIDSRFNLISNYAKEITTKADEIIIINNFNSSDKKHIPMKFLLRHWLTDQFGNLCYVNDETVEKYCSNYFRNNILKTGNMPLSMYEDLLVIEIDTTKFK